MPKCAGRVLVSTVRTKWSTRPVKQAGSNWGATSDRLLIAYEGKQEMELKNRRGPVIQTAFRKKLEEDGLSRSNPLIRGRRLQDRGLDYRRDPIGCVVGQALPPGFRRTVLVHGVG